MIVVVGSQEWRRMLSQRARSRRRARAATVIFLALCVALGFYLGAR